MIKDPEITLKNALAAFGGNQSHLASFLGVSRAAITDWKKNERQLVPTLQAYRLINGMPDVFSKAA